MMRSEKRWVPLFQTVLAYLPLYLCISAVYYQAKEVSKFLVIAVSMLLGIALSILTKLFAKEIKGFTLYFCTLLVTTLLCTSALIEYFHIFGYPEFILIAYMFPGAIVYLLVLTVSKLRNTHHR